MHELHAFVKLIQNFNTSLLFKDSLDAVEDMIKKQDELEKMLIRQQERFKELGRETKAERLERDRIEMEEKRIREEREARHREEKRRLEELKKKEEEVWYS